MIFWITLAITMVTTSCTLITPCGDTHRHTHTHTHTPTHTSSPGPLNLGFVHVHSNTHSCLECEGLVCVSVYSPSYTICGNLVHHAIVKHTYTLSLRLV